MTSQLQNLGFLYFSGHLDFLSLRGVYRTKLLNFLKQTSSRAKKSLLVKVSMDIIDLLNAMNEITLPGQLVVSSFNAAASKQDYE